MGGDLAVFERAEERNALAQISASLGMSPWVGLYQDRTSPYYSEPSGGWKWINGTPYEPNWSAGEPNNCVWCCGSDEDYAQMYVDGTYNDDCNVDYDPFIVEMMSNQSVLWSTGAMASSITVYPSQTTMYYATLSDGITSCTDSVLVTVKQTSSSFTTAEACDSYTWNDYVYTESGTYSITYTNAEGCDSVAVLELTITPSITNTTTASACDSYTWTANGNTYTESLS